MHTCRCSLKKHVKVQVQDYMCVYIQFYNAHAAEKATEILREVKGAQEAFRKQKDLQKLEAEVCTLDIHFQPF